MFSMIKYHLVLNLRERTMVFWTLAFPLLLGIFFYFGLGGIDEASAFDTIPVAVVQNEILSREEQADIPDKQEIFAEFMDGISGEVIEPVYVTDKAQAEKMLEDGKISGIFDLTGDEIALTVDENGLEQSILKALLDGFEQQTAILTDAQDEMQPELDARIDRVKNAGEHMKDLGEHGLWNEMSQAQDELEAAKTAVTDYADLMSQKLQGMADSMKSGSTDYVKEVSLGGRNVSSVAPYYFALVAMACLYMCFLGETAARHTQANISEIGKRISLSPVQRMKVVLSNGISAYLIALVNMALILLFLTKVVHGLDLSMHRGYAILTAVIGCLIGVTFGILIESIGKWSQNIKSAILIGSSIFCAFLAGLMISDMKDIIEKHVPIVNRLNPAALIADSFYCICVYDDMGRLQMNLVIMCVMSAAFLIVAWLMTRRVRYDNL